MAAEIGAYALDPLNLLDHASVGSHRTELIDRPVPEIGVGRFFCAGRQAGTGKGRDGLKKVLTIAGSDSSGGAGIQADLKTMTAHGVYGMSAVTALTAQNTAGVTGVLEAPPDFVGQQLDRIFEDIRPDAVKIGMVSSAAIIRAIAAKLREYRAEHIVVDPVMVATSGSRLMEGSAAAALAGELFPLAEIITPNLAEAAALCGFAVETPADMERAARALGAGLPGALLLKGGHLSGSADDLLWQGGAYRWYRAPRVDNPNNHGSGCTLSSAIACNLALGHSLEDAVARAKAYITRCMEAGLDLGAGSGPLNHCFAIHSNAAQRDRAGGKTGRRGRGDRLYSRLRGILRGRALRDRPGGGL